MGEQLGTKSYLNSLLNWSAWKENISFKRELRLSAHLNSPLDGIQSLPIFHKEWGLIRYLYEISEQVKIIPLWKQHETTLL